MSAQPAGNWVTAAQQWCWLNGTAKLLIGQHTPALEATAAEGLNTTFPHQIHLPASHR